MKPSSVVGDLVPMQLYLRFDRHSVPGLDNGMKALQSSATISKEMYGLDIANDSR